MMGQAARARKQFPQWVLDEGIFAATSHEPLKFYRRLGSDNATWREEWYKKHRTEEFAKLMAAAGLNHVNLAFFKGFGLDEEREEIEDLRARIPVFHRHGIKVRAYVQFGSLMYETFLKEVPEAAEWCKRDAEGRIITYRWGKQYWRWRPCFNKPEFLAYLKKVIDLAIDAGVDAIGLDNVKQGWAGDYADYCYCQTCRRLFRECLKGNLARREELVGISGFDFVEPPPVHHPKDVISQAWVRFQDERRHEAVRELYEYAKAKKPDLLINTNGLPAHVTAACTDAATWEGHYWPRMEDDEIVCGAHAYKHGNDRGIYVYVASAPAFGDGDGERPDDPKLRALKLGIAQAAAFGGHGVFVPAICSGMRGPNFPLEKPAFADTCKRYSGFFRKYRRHFHPLESAASVAIYLNWASWNLDGHRADDASRLVEQALMRDHILWDIFYLRPLDEIRRYDVVVFPEISCLSDEEAEAIESFVAGGGGIVVLGETSAYNEHFRERLEPALGRIFKDSRIGSDGCREAAFGKGKAVWLELPEERSRGDAWRHFPQLSSAVRAAHGSKSLPLELTAPDSVVVDAYQVLGRNELVISLMNFDGLHRALEAKLELASRRFGRVAQAFWASPDADSDEPRSLPVASSASGCEVVVPEVDVYSLVVARTKRE